MVTDQNSEQNLLENGGILINDDLRSSQTLINNRIIPESITSDGGTLILPETEANRQQQILVQPASDANQNYAERSDTALLRLMKNGEYEKSQLVHLGFGSNVEMASNICEPNLENMQNVYTNLQNAPKKRKISQETPLVKSEPGGLNFYFFCVFFLGNFCFVFRALFAGSTESSRSYERFN